MRRARALVLALVAAVAVGGALAVDGMAVHLRDEGPRDDPEPIVLLHATAASLHTWEGWTRALARRRRVIRAGRSAGIRANRPVPGRVALAERAWVAKLILVDSGGYAHASRKTPIGF